MNLFVLLFASMLPSQFTVPNVSISIKNAGGVVDYGDIVILRADVDNTHLSEGLVNIGYNWVVMDEGREKNVFVTDGGRSIAFGAGIKPKRITVMLDVNCLFEKKQTITVVDKEGKNPTPKEIITEAVMISPPPIFTEVQVGATSPDPSPTPSPIHPLPAPSPVLPSGQFGLAKFMYDTFMGYDGLDNKTKAMIAVQLANSLEVVAANIADTPDYKDVATILADTKRRSDAAFAQIPGLDFAKAELLKIAIRQKMSSLYKDGKMNTAADIAAMWKEMALGLRAVR